MTSGKVPAFLPDSSGRAPRPQASKMSAFERQRAESEAKRQRDAAETASVYEDFVKTFDRDGGGGGGEGGGRGDGQGGSQRSYPAQQRGGMGPQPVLHDRIIGPSRRHFGLAGSPPPMPKSGPGSSGPNPSSTGRKRPFDVFWKGSRDERGEDEAGTSGSTRGPRSISKVFHDSDDDEDDSKSSARDEAIAVSRPTLRLSNLPPATSPAVVKSLMPANLVVEGVKMVSGTSGQATERKSTVAIVTLSKDTPATQMDGAVSSLQGRYLGFGYNLSLHRHLSSMLASSTTALPAPGASLSLSLAGPAAQPFGAKPVSENTGGRRRHDVVGHGSSRRFAPPSSYEANPRSSINRGNIAHVPVRPPSCIKTIRLITMVLERMLEYGPDFEALLMSRPEVQKEEKWAWIWDARSTAGVWYRWRLWEIVTGGGGPSGRGRDKFVPLFDGSAAWRVPDRKLAFEWTTSLDEFVDGSDYNSSDDDDDDGDGGQREAQSHDDKAMAFLNPLEKAKLAHLLARLPTSFAKLRKGDIARVSAFAISHASRGADEVVDMIVANIEIPLSRTGTTFGDKSQGGSKDSIGYADTRALEDKSGVGGVGGAGEVTDVSTASLVGLYVLSDVLSSSSTSGVRHAWRYRQLAQTTLKERGTFELLGLMAERLGWGRMRADKWKRSVGLILKLWQGWCVFPVEVQEHFVGSFEKIPELRPDSKIEDEGSKKGKWKLVENTAMAHQGVDEARMEQRDVGEDDRAENSIAEGQDAPGVPIYDDDGDDNDGDNDVEDAVGIPMDEDEDGDQGEGRDDSQGDYDVQGEPMDEDGTEGAGGGAEGAETSETAERADTEQKEQVEGFAASEKEDSDQTAKAAIGQPSPQGLSPGRRPRVARKRMRAADICMSPDPGERGEGEDDGV